MAKSRSEGYQIPSLQYDMDAAKTFVITDQNGSIKIGLQFPPKIVSESKGALWDETDRYGYEELAVFKGSRAKNINLEINYVVWDTWDQTKICGEVRKIKKHLYVHGGGALDKVPFLEIEGWKVIDGDPQPFRVMNISINYSREYVGQGKNYWPLHTKVVLDLKLLTAGGSIESAKKFRETRYQSGILAPAPRQEWY